MVELRAGVCVGLDLAPASATAIGLRVPPKWEAMSLVALIRRAAGPGPAGMVHVVGLGRAERIEPAEFFERREMLRIVVGMPFCASNSLMVPFWPSAEEPLSPQM